MSDKPEVRPEGHSENKFGLPDEMPPIELIEDEVEEPEESFVDEVIDVLNEPRPENSPGVTGASMPM